MENIIPQSCKVTSLYGGKLALHEFDDRVTYWSLNGERPGLLNIINRGLGHDMTRQIELLARNAFLSSPFALYGSGSGTKFNTVESTDSISTERIDDIRLGMEYRGVPFANDGVQSLSPYNTTFCITSPGVIRDLQYEASNNSKAQQFLNVMSYADPMRVANGEVGLYHNVRFISNPDCVLWNCGDIINQQTIDAAITAGDGAPDPASSTVDGVWYSGQPGAQATHYITVADGSGFSVGDEVTIHATRTSDFGVTNGVDYREGKAHKRRIVAINTNDISFDLPIMENFSTDLGGGVYGYVTKARHIHASIFIGGMDAVVMGVLAPPSIVVPPTVDDLMSMKRIAWKGRFGFTAFEPAAMEVLFSAGSNRIVGDRYSN